MIGYEFIVIICYDGIWIVRVGSGSGYEKSNFIWFS